MARHNGKLSRERLSQAVIIYKILLGVVEFIFGLGLLLVGIQIYDKLLQVSTGRLNSDPDDFWVIVTSKYIPYILDHRYYLAILFLCLGFGKIMGGIGMLYQKSWARHLLIGLLTAFLPYDLIGLIRDLSRFEILYFAFNILVVLYFMDFKPRAYVREVWLYLQQLYPY